MKRLSATSWPLCMQVKVQQTNTARRDRRDTKENKQFKLLRLRIRFAIHHAFLQAHRSCFKVSFSNQSSNFGALGLPSWRSERWVTPCDGPLLSRIFTWRSVPCENCTLRFGPKDFDWSSAARYPGIRNQIAWKSSTRQQNLYHHSFRFLVRLTVNLSWCLNTHFSPNLHPDSA